MLPCRGPAPACSSSAARLTRTWEGTRAARAHGTYGPNADSDHVQSGSDGVCERERERTACSRDRMARVCV